MLIALSTVWLVGLVVSYTDARLPPKFLKATNNVGKIYAGRFGYTVVPVTPKFLVQAVARKEVHVPVLRPVRKKRRPQTGRRPGPPPPPPEYGGGGYHDYPQPAPSKKHPRLRKPPKYRRKPRPPPRDADYYEQEIEDEIEDFGEYDYEEKHHDKPLKGYEDRPSKRGYSSSTKSHDRPKGPVYNSERYRTRFEDDDEFIAQHSELYASGYPPGKSKPRPPRLRDEEIEHHFGPPSGRKPKPPPKGFKGPSRPSSKLYSASVPPPRRPYYHKGEERYRYEDEDEEEVSPRPRYKKRPKIPEEENYDEAPHYKDSDREIEQEKETGYSRPGGVIHEEYEYNPDNFYHDRKFESKQKAKRGTEDKERDGEDKPRPHKPVSGDDDRKHFHPSEMRDEERRESDRKEQPRRKKEKPRIKQEEHQQEHRAAPEGKWSIPFSIEPEDDDAWDQAKSKVIERPPRKQSESLHELPMPPRPKKVDEKPVSEYETAQSSWPVIVQGLNWKDAPHPFVENHNAELFNNWQNFQIPQWPNLDEQLGKFPESLRSTFKWVEPTNQTPLHPTPTPPNHRTTTRAPALAIPTVDYNSKAIGSQSSSNEPRRKKSSKRSKDRAREDTEVVAQRVVGGTLQLNGGFKQEPQKEEWANPAFLSAAKNPGRSPQQQYTVEMFKTVEPGKPFEGDIVYGTRITDSKFKKIEPDIGYHSGMETIDDDIGGWQVY